MAQQTAAADLLDLTDALGALIEREAEILRGARPAAIAQLQDEKSDLTERYAAALAALRQDPAALAALPRDAREALRAATATFRARLAGNVRALETARQVNERLIRAIGEAVAAQRAPAAGYSAAGARGATDVRRPAASAAIALDRHV